MTSRTHALTGRLGASLREAPVLLAVALAVAVIAWFMRSEKLPLRPDVARHVYDLSAGTAAVAEALELYDAGTHYFVDTRPDEPGGGIPGSFRVREASFADDLFEQRDFLYPDVPVIVYGEDNLQQVSAVAARLQERGFADVKILAEGLSGWRAAGGPVSGEEAGE